MISSRPHIAALAIAPSVEDRTTRNWAGGDTPSLPSLPGGPASPCLPCAPVCPVAPVSPLSPLSPLGPEQPAKISASPTAAQKDFFILKTAFGQGTASKRMPGPNVPP